MEIISFDNSKKGIAKNAFWGFVFQFIIKLKGLIILPLIVYFLPKETIGEWRFIMTSVGILIPVVTLNLLDGSGIFFSSDLEKRRIRVKYYTIFHLVLLLTIIFIIISVFSRSFFPLLDVYYLALALYLLSAILRKLSTFLFQTYQKAISLIKINLALEYGSASLTLLLLLIGVRNLYSLLLPMIIVNFLISISLFVIINKEIRYKICCNSRFIKKVLPISIPLMPVFIAEWLMGSVGIYLLKYQRNMEDVGTYSVLLSIASLIITLRATLQFFWFSTCSNLIPNKKYIEFQSIMLEVLKVYFVTSLLVLIVYAFYAKDLIMIFSDASYLSIRNPLFITSSGNVLMVFSTIWNGVLYSLGKSKRILGNYVISALIMVLLSYILINRYGIIGASVAYFFGNMTLFLLMYFSVRKVKVKMTIKEKGTSIFFLIILVLTFSSKMINLDNNLQRIIGVIMMGLILFALLLTKYIEGGKLIQIIKKR